METLAQKQRQKVFLGGEVTQEVYDKVKALAEQDDRPMRYMIQKLLEEGLKEYE